MAARTFLEEAAAELVVFVTTSSAVIEALARQLDQIPITFDSADEVSKVVEACDAIEQDDDNRKKITNAINGLHYALASTKATISDVVEGAVASVSRWFPESLRDPSTEEDLKLKLRVLLSVKSIALSNKAYSLRAEQERIFLDGRVLTDVRPVFAEDLNDPLPAALICHTLRLTYEVAGKAENQEFFLAMGSKDLESLKDALERAMKKSMVLKKTIPSVVSQILESD